MEYKVAEKGGFRVLGLKTELSTVNQEHLKKIPQLWQEIYQDGTLDRLMQLGVAEGCCPHPLGLCLMEEARKNSILYMIGVKAPEGAAGEEWDNFVVPALTWAVFSVAGKIPEAIQQAFRQIYAGPFPIDDYHRAVGPDIEVYFDGDMNSPDYRCEVWIPVMKSLEVKK